MIDGEGFWEACAGEGKQSGMNERYGGGQVTEGSKRWMRGGKGRDCIDWGLVMGCENRM